jgi:protease PrsW
MPPPTPLGWRKVLFYGSRSKRTLWQVSIGILLVGIVVGIVGSRYQRAEPPEFADRVLARAGLAIEHDEDELDRAESADDQPESRHPSIVTALAQELAAPKVRFIHLIRSVPQLAPHIRAAEQSAVRAVLEKRFSGSEANLAMNFIAAWRESDRGAYDQLKAQAEAAPPVRYANYALGRLEVKRHDYASAARYFQREGQQATAYESRHRAVIALAKGRDFAALSILQKDPNYQEFFTPYVSLKIAAAKRDWPAILRLSPQVQFDGYSGVAIAMSLILGFAWAFFLGHLGQWPRFWSSASALSVIAFACGVASTVLTLYLVVLQEDVLKVAPGEDPVRVFLYFIAGVGAREEFCKLLFFAPLLPVLLRRDHELEALVIASFVGLGFAIEENTGYFMDSAGTSGASRFLTATFFHMALTGVSGLALYRAFRWGVRGWNEFLWVFPVSVAAHGAYDALLDRPGIGEGGYIAMVVFVGFCFLYFERAHQLRENLRMTISLTGAFVVGTALVAASLIAYVIMTLGLAAGGSFAASELVGCAVLVIMFVRVFNEPLST